MKLSEYILAIIIVLILAFSVYGVMMKVLTEQDDRQATNGLN